MKQQKSGSEAMGSAGHRSVSRLQYTEADDIAKMQHALFMNSGHFRVTLQNARIFEGVRLPDRKK
jgi:hypothetical protein